MRNDILGQVPWGKHNPSNYRLIHYAKHSAGIVGENVFPVVVIKYPFTWMHSICRHWYALNFSHENCPTLLFEKRGETFNMTEFNGDEEMLMSELKNQRHNQASIGFPKNRSKYDDMLDFWNTWYSDYINEPFPKIVIRFEDLLFRQEEIISSICACADGKMSKQFKYVDKSAKSGGAHGGSHGRDEALARYGSEKLRNENFSELDKAYIDRFADKKLMDMFHYGNSKGDHDGWVEK